MGRTNILLTRRAVVQAGVEAVYGTPLTLGANDGVLATDPNYTVDPNVLERNIARDDISPMPIIIGRKLARMEFSTELRGNGREHSGLAADAPAIARLFRACGYLMTASTAPSAYGTFVIGDHPVDVDMAIHAGALTNTDVVAYYLNVTTGGPSGTAQITVTSDTIGEGGGPYTVTSGSRLGAGALGAETIGTFGLGITPTFTGNLVLGMRWIIWLLPTGIRLDPISDDFESVTLQMNKDGVEHLMPGSFGTFEITAEAGAFATVSWTFTGTYVAPVDTAMPQPNYERTLPSQVELARLRLDAYNAVVNRFTYNQANDIQIRPDVNSTEGYIGTRIVSRTP